MKPTFFSDGTLKSNGDFGLLATDQAHIVDQHVKTATGKLWNCLSSSLHAS